MDINLNNFGNFNVGREPQNVAPAASEVKTSAATANAGSSGLKTTELKKADFDALRGSEPVFEVPDSALSRDDDLGKLVKAAFNFPPPPMPFNV